MDVIVHTGRGAPTDRRRALRSCFLLSLVSLVLAIVPALVAATARAGVAKPAPIAWLVEREGGPRLVASLLLDREDETHARVGVLLELSPGWHVYWRNPGDTGVAPELAFETSANGAAFGELLWPVPSVFRGPGSELGLRSYGYEDRVLLAAPLVFEKPPAAGVRIAVTGDVLICESECVPAVFRLERTLASGLEGWTPTRERALFDHFAARLPESPEKLGVEIGVAYSQSAIRPGDRFEAAIGVRSCARPMRMGSAASSEKRGDCLIFEPHPPEPQGAIFLPHTSGTLELQTAAVLSDRADSKLRWLPLTAAAEPDEPLDLEQIVGVLWLRGGGELHAVEISLPFASAAEGSEVAQLGTPWQDANTLGIAAGVLPLARALLLALLGGLVLNLMPCVLPVLAIKVFSISELARSAHADPREPLRHGAAYTLGILASMAALAVCVVALRAAGHAVGWGFQFQEPAYVAAISALLVAFALNLFGAFEIQAGVGGLASLGQQATGARRSFFEGLLAVALATPCSAPFLGTAIGFAFASEPPVIAAIFLAVGLGLALPFLLVTLVPAWARFMPRSGAWMHGVRCGLGFALLATVVWLLWILGRAAGADGILRTVAFLLALAFALWAFGLVQRAQQPRTALFAALGVVAIGVGGLNVVSAGLAAAPAANGPESAARSEADGWQTWSPEAVDGALAAGAPAFVRFTADWCITCKVNERVVLQDDAVTTALEQGGFRRFVADWTRRDEAIRSELARHGRAGVPLYLVYDPEHPEEPRLLPELLTLDKTLEAIRRAARGS